jgi:hypothetical protein
MNLFAKVDALATPLRARRTAATGGEVFPIRSTYLKFGMLLPVIILKKHGGEGSRLNPW